MSVLQTRYVNFQVLLKTMKTLNHGTVLFLVVLSLHTLVDWAELQNEGFLPFQFCLAKDAHRHMFSLSLATTPERPIFLFPTHAHAVRAFWETFRKPIQAEGAFHENSVA